MRFLLPFLWYSKLSAKGIINPKKADTADYDDIGTIETFWNHRIFIYRGF